MYPDIQAKVREEVIEVITDEDQIKEETLHKLTYTKAVLNESLRLRPPVTCKTFINCILTSTAMPRTATKDIELCGIFVPKGTTVNAFVHGTHLDPKYWENPTEFRPERWMVSEMYSLCLQK